MTDYLIDRLINVNNVYMFVEGQETALKNEIKQGIVWIDAT